MRSFSSLPLLLLCSWHIKLLATLLLCCQESGALAKTKIKHWLWCWWAQPPLCYSRHLIPDPLTLPRIPAHEQQPLASPSQQGSALCFKMCEAAGKAQRPLRASALPKQLGSVAALCSAQGAQISSWRPITRLGRANEQPRRGHELPKEQMCPKSVPVNFVTYWNHGEIYTANYWLCFWFNHPSLHLSVKVRREKMLLNSMSEAGWCFKQNHMTGTCLGFLKKNIYQANILTKAFNLAMRHILTFICEPESFMKRKQNDLKTFPLFWTWTSERWTADISHQCSGKWMMGMRSYRNTCTETLILWSKHADRKAEEGTRVS